MSSTTALVLGFCLFADFDGWIFLVRMCGYNDSAEKNVKKKKKISANKCIIGVKTQKTQVNLDFSDLFQQHI